MERHATASCTHRWILGDPHFGKVDGACRRCGAQRTFPSGLEIPESVPDFEELKASAPELFVETIQEEAPV